MATRGRPTPVIELSDSERETLQRWVRRHSSAQALALRSRIVLACAEGRTNKEVAAAQRVNPATVSKWRHRFVLGRLEGLVDAARPGAQRTIDDATIEAVVVDTLGRHRAKTPIGPLGVWPPSTGSPRPRWRRSGGRSGFNRGSRTPSWCPPDPDLIEKVRDLVGLYMNPPDAAAVFAVDEKPQIQALDRTAPTLPMLPTTPQRATHDYARNGTVDLFAALDVARGTVISDIRTSHNQDDFIAFSNKINREVPAELDVHIILDNLSTHNTPKVQRWLLRHRRFHMHFTPTYGSWMNLVERWFSALTNKELQRSAHRSAKELAADINAWVATWNADPKPFVWHKTAEQILERLASYCTAINHDATA